MRVPILVTRKEVINIEGPVGSSQELEEMVDYEVQTNMKQCVSYSIDYNSLIEGDY